MIRRLSRPPVARSATLTTAVIAAALSFAPIVALAASSEAHENRAELRINQPVYVPPPVYYAACQSSGISRFFPLDLR